MLEKIEKLTSGGTRLFGTTEQKNRQKMQTYINCIEQNNDHARIIHKTRFRSSFRVTIKKMFIWSHVYVIVGKNTSTT